MLVGGCTAPFWRAFTRPRSIAGSQNILRPIRETTQIGPVLNVSVSYTRVSIGFEVSLPLHGTAWTRISRSVTLSVARQSSYLAPEIEGTYCVFWKWRNRSRPGPARRPVICATGSRLRFIWKHKRQHHPTGCNPGGQTLPPEVHGRTVIGILFQTC